MALIRISALNIFPVKSCAGIAVQQSRLTATGLEHDRRWMFIKPDGHFLTQREFPRMALIKPALREQGIELAAPGMPLLMVRGDDESLVREVAIWRDCCYAFDEGDEAAQWASEFLQASVRLVRFNDAHQRLSSRQWTGELQAPNHFTDGYPILVISTASLDDLNSRLSVPLVMNRFRPNVVIEAVTPYLEDTIDELRCDEFALRLVKPCIRCKITTTNQDTGVVEGDEPLLTLLQYRRSLELKGVAFGQNAVILSGTGGTVSVGQSLSFTLRDISR